MLTIFVVAPFVSDVSVYEYFRKLQNYDISEIFYTIVFKPPNLPGVFSNNPIKTLNGSLWTLSWEVFCYFCLVLLKYGKRLDKRGFFLFPLFLFLAFLRFDINQTPANQIPYYEPLLFCSAFVLGASFYVYREYIPLRKIYILISVVIIILMKIFSIYISIAYLLAVTYITIYVALINGHLAKIGKYGDFSYGIYIYSQFIQQIIAGYYNFNQNYFVQYILISFSIIMLLAIISWHYVEKPILFKIHKMLALK